MKRLIRWRGKLRGLDQSWRVPYDCNVPYPVSTITRRADVCSIYLVAGKLSNDLG